MQVLCLYETRKSKPRLKSELRKQKYTVALFFDCNPLANVIVLWQIQKFMCYCTVFTLSYFEFEGNFWVQALGGLYLEGQFIGLFFFFALRVWGAYIWKGLLTWRGLFSEFYGNTLCFSPKFCIIYCFQMLNFVSSKRERELFLWNHLFPVNMYSK